MKLKKISYYICQRGWKERETELHHVLVRDQSVLEPVQTGVKIHREITISQLSPLIR